MPTRVITPPEVEPVTLEQAKDHLRLEHDLDDDYVTALIKAAREHVEEKCWRGLVTQTVELVLPEFGCRDCIELPRGNLVSIASVKYLDADGVQQTWPAENYSKDDVTVPGRVRLAYGKSWPSARCQWDAVRIQYVVGWDQENVPATIKQAVLLLVSQMYEHRTPEVLGAVPASVKFAVDALLSNHRLLRF